MNQRIGTYKSRINGRVALFLGYGDDEDDDTMSDDTISIESKKELDSLIKRLKIISDSPWAKTLGKSRESEQ